MSCLITSTGVAVAGGASAEAVKTTTLPPPSLNSGASQGSSRRLLTITISGSGGRPSRSRSARLAGSEMTRP